MTKGVVVVYFSSLGGRLSNHQKIMLEADAKAIAKIKQYEFGDSHHSQYVNSDHVFFVPDDTLLQNEAASLGIRGADDLFGGIVPHAFVKTKAISHPLVVRSAERPDGWSDAFSWQVRDVTLPGYTVFTARDAHIAANRMIANGAIRVKKPLGASGKGQILVATAKELDAFLEKIPADEMATYGLVLEENLRKVTTLSVGRVAVGELMITYYGTQRVAKDNGGKSVYGGSDLVCVRGGWDALDVLPMTAEVRNGVAKAKLYDAAMSEYPGFVASRRNYDVGHGVDAKGERRCGVFESSWRVGGATSAELVAIGAFLQDPSLKIVQTSHVEVFGKHHEAPQDAIVHFQGEDPDAGPLLRYTFLNRTGENPR
jgi:hypothetical protein